MKVLILFALASCTLAVDNSRYYGDTSGSYAAHPADGRYIPDNSGQYIPDYSGRYIPDGLGGYLDDGTGRYSGQKNDYRQGKDRFGKYGNGFNDNLIGSGTANAQVIRPAPKPVVTTTTTTPRPTPPPAQFKYDNYKEGGWKIIRQLSDFDTDGGYHWEYETENKIQAEESGKLFNKDTDAEAIRAKGFYQYTGPDNVVYSVVYTADENGFIPIGDHIPTPPPIPAGIARALEYKRANKKL